MAVGCAASAGSPAVVRAARRARLRNLCWSRRAGRGHSLRPAARVGRNLQLVGSAQGFAHSFQRMLLGRDDSSVDRQAEPRRVDKPGVVGKRRCLLADRAGSVESLERGPWSSDSPAPPDKLRNTRAASTDRPAAQAQDGGKRVAGKRPAQVAERCDPPLAPWPPASWRWVVVAKMAYSRNPPHRWSRPKSPKTASTSCSSTLPAGPVALTGNPVRLIKSGR